MCKICPSWNAMSVLIALLFSGKRDEEIPLVLKDWNAKGNQAAQHPQRSVPMKFHLKNSAYQVPTDHVTSL